MQQNIYFWCKWMNMKPNNKRNGSLRRYLHEIIFEADTPMGRRFDLILLILIGLSVLIVVLESIEWVHLVYGRFFITLEWIFTIIFTIEYGLRLYSVKKPLKYATSFFGLVDLLAILPTYLSIFMAGSQHLIIIRALRLIRIFRIFKMGHFLREGTIILVALRRSRAKITVFMTFVLLMILIFGSLMYVIEGGSNPDFSNIPRSVYWAIVTLTTVGYGDITPVTPLGQLLSAALMITGYAVIAVPTGIVSAEMVDYNKKKEELSTQVCEHCSREGHDSDAKYCKYCGELLNE
jgi:voltage-gated potassium channel